jgi:ADP-dependent NAD(P)H-hydrate dehydratase
VSGCGALDADLLARFPLPRHPEDAGKEDRGRLLAIAGSRELPGAALLAGTAALRAGAGKLQIATAGSIAVPLAVAMPEARVIGHSETDDGCIADEGIAPLLGWVEAAQAVMIGCGMQHGRPLERLLAGILASGANVPLVLDAAALGCLDAVRDALRAWPSGAVILPHSGEMARLLGRTRDQVEADPMAAAREAAERYCVVAVIKGRYSFIVAPDGRAFRFNGGGVGLATSGSGDTLAGIVGGLAARGADLLAAALWGVWLHGEAGRILARKVGPIGFLARELPELVPGLLESVGTQD